MRVCACTVQFRDRRGVDHSTEVRASSVYEAACRAWAKFKSAPETEEESYKAEEFVVQMHEEAKTFHVNLEKLLDWLGRGRRGHKDTPRKEQLRRLLDANISGSSVVREH